MKCFKINSNYVNKCGGTTQVLIVPGTRYPPPPRGKVFYSPLTAEGTGSDYADRDALDQKVRISVTMS